MRESKEELKSFLMMAKEDWNSWLKTQHSKNEDHGIGFHHCMAKMGKNGNSDRLPFFQLHNHCGWWNHEIIPWNQKTLAPRKKSYKNVNSILKKQRHHFTNKGSCCQSYGFSSSNVWMWMFEHKEDWVPKNWVFELWCWRRLWRVP